MDDLNYGSEFIANIPLFKLQATFDLYGGILPDILLRLLVVLADLVRAYFNKLGLALAAAGSDLAGDVLDLLRCELIFSFISSKVIS